MYQYKYILHLILWSDWLKACVKVPSDELFSIPSEWAAKLPKAQSMDGELHSFWHILRQKNILFNSEEASETSLCWPHNETVASYLHGLDAKAKLACWSLCQDLVRVFISIWRRHFSQKCIWLHFLNWGPYLTNLPGRSKASHCDCYQRPRGQGCGGDEMDNDCE